MLFLVFGLFYKSQNLKGKAFPVSLLVCSKNEAENLKTHIPLWLAQAHPRFELILIDDNSTDTTRQVIEQFAAQDERIIPVFVAANERFKSSKKYALTLGIKKANHMRLVFTDADCAPASTMWLSKMATSFSATKQLILGYGPYSKKTNLVNPLVRYETFITALQYFSYAFAGMPYMGVGRNLGYTRLLYDQQKGFSSHMDVRSGDDDLFVNAAATKENTALNLDPDTFMYSAPKTSFKHWIQQKRRHVSTANHYKKKHKILLGLYYVANFGFWFVLGIYFFSDPIVAATLLIIRLIVQIGSYLPTALKLKTGSLLVLAPILELFLICMQLVIFIMNLFSTKTAWK